MRAYWRQTGAHPPGHPEGRFWTPEKDAVLGTARDAVVAKRLGRSVQAVYLRRHDLGVPGFLVEVDGRKLRRLREAAGPTQHELARRAGLHPGKPRALESGREKSVRKDALARLARVLKCKPGLLLAR